VAHGIAANSLQAGAIGVEGEIAVTQGNLAVEAGPVNIVRATTAWRSMGGFWSASALNPLPRSPINDKKNKRISLGKCLRRQMQDRWRKVIE
jgi:hypothetical protein